MKNAVNPVPIYERYGLYGGFDGDERLVVHIRSFETLIEAGKEEESFTKLTMLANHLPVKGRQELANFIVSQNQQLVDTFLSKLLDYILMTPSEGYGALDNDISDDYLPEEVTDPVESAIGAGRLVDQSLLDPTIDEDFVWVAKNHSDDSKSNSDQSDNEELRIANRNRYTHGEVFLALLPRASTVQIASVCKQYLQSASTQYRTTVSCQMVYTPTVSDEELIQLYNCESSTNQEGMVLAMTKTIAGKYEVNRVNVLEILLQKGKHLRYKYLASSEFIRKELSKKPDMRLQNWSFHHKIYMMELQSRLGKCRIDTKCGNGVDRIQCGKVWNTFIGQIHMGEQLREEHIDALSRIMEEYTPCTIQSSVPLPVQHYLEQISAEGERDILTYKEVTKCTLANRLLLTLPKKVRKEKLWHAFQLRNIETFRQLNDLVNMDRGFFAIQIFTQATEEDFWNHILARPSKEGDKFFKYMANDLNFNFTKNLSVTIDTIFSWHELHLRFAPGRVSAKVSGWIEQEYKTSEEAWRQWCKSYQRGVNGYVNGVQEKFLEASQNRRPLDQSRVTLYARTLRFLMEETLKGIHAAEGHIPKTVWIDCIHNIMDGTYGKEKLSFGQKQELNSPTRVKELAKVWEDVTMKYVMTDLQTLLDFDPRNYGEEKSHSYVDSSKIEKFGSRLKKWIVSSTSHQVLEVSFQVAKDCISRAQAQDRHISVPNCSQQHFLEVTNPDTGEVTFAFYDSTLHMKAIDQCLQCMKALMAHQQVSIALKKKVWKEVLQQNLKAAFLDSDIDYIKYFCILPKEIRSSSEENLIKHARSMIMRGKDRNIFTHECNFCLEKISDVGLLEKVLTGNIVSDEIREHIYEHHGSFQSEMVRDILRGKIEHRDGDKRGQGHVLWLQRAGKALKPTQWIVDAVGFTTNRIKNEAGIYKRPVFNQLSNMISSGFVNKTLATGEEEDAKSMAAFLLQILQNDLERRDSIANHYEYFPRIASSILEQALRFDPTKKQIDIRAIWIQCSIQISWLLAKARGSSQHFEFALSGEKDFLPVTKWIQESEFDKVFPHREYPIQLSMMRFQVHLVEVVKNFDETKVFGPNNAVELMVEALQNVWEKRITSSMPFELGPYLPSESATAKGVMRRFEQLFTLSSIHFEDSTFLTEAFDNLYGESMSSAPMNHFCFAEDLLKKIICATTSGKVFEHLRLAKAIDAIFRYCLQNNLRDKACFWLEYWKEVEVYGSRNRLHHVDNRLLRTLIKHDWLQYLKGYSADKNLHKMCSFANKLLTITSSALIHSHVQQIVFQYRPDVLLRYQKIGKLQGVFQEKEKSNMDCITLLYHNTHAVKLENFPPKLAKLYSSYAYQLSLDDSLNIKKRILAMERFATCPTTNNSNILSVLADETLEPPFVEAITLRIFSLDSPWHVLAHLLSAEALCKRRQNTTASLLAHVEKHVPIHQTIKCLELLLAPSRRDVLGFSLHKAILRMLFGTNTFKSKELLQSEWENNDIPKDVRYEFIILCLRAVVVNDGSVDWEWKILNSLVTNKALLSEETSLKLLSVMVDQHFIRSATNRNSIESAQEESAIVSLRLLFAHVVVGGSIDKRRRFYTLSEQLSINVPQVDLRRVALLKKWELSSIFQKDSKVAKADANSEDDREGTLEEIEEAILAAPPTCENDAFLIIQMSCAYGRGLSLCLNRAAKHNAEWKKGLMTREKWLDICKEHPLAQRTCCFIDNLLTLDDRRSWIALDNICKNLGKTLSYLECFDEKNSSKSSRIFKFLEEKERDARLVLSVTTAVRNQVNWPK